MRFPKSRHYNPTPGSGASGSGAPGGAANSIQVNNGAGGFQGVGELTSSKITLQSGNGSGDSGIILLNGANEYSGEFLANPGAYSGGSTTTNVLDGSHLSNNSTVFLECFIQLIQTSATPGSTGMCFKVKGAFRKDNSGTLTQIGASVYDASDTFNDTGDSLSGTPSLGVTGGAIAITFNLTTVKTLRVARWVKFRAVKS